MKRLAIFIFSSFLIVFQAFSQTYILNEDFSGTSGTNPPSGWTNSVISGVGSDLWHFDNPGERPVGFPVLEPFAIFDSEAVSGNGQPEEAALESPSFDASASNFILLQIDHLFDPGNGATGMIEAYDGSNWQEVASFTSPVPNTASELLDLSPSIGGITNAKLRFVWSGSSSGYWAIDNIRIYASLALDGGVVSIDSPVTPVTPGNQPVEITLGNFGYETITSTVVEWTADGVPQNPYTWNGNMGFGQTQENVQIGSYNFQGPVVLKIWQRNPNGQTDPNPYNDTITQYLTTPLCGTYTVGGNNPDFETLGDVADVLNSAGITCTVDFLIRDGVYPGKLYLSDIPGTSAVNTVTFRSQSGNNQQALIQLGTGSVSNDPVIHLDGSSYVNIRNLGIVTGNTSSTSNYGVLMEGAGNIGIQGCYFEAGRNNDIGLFIREASQDIEVTQNEINCTNPRAKAMNVRDQSTQNIIISGNSIQGGNFWENKSVTISNFVSNLTFSDNTIESGSWAVYVFWSDNIEISRNTISDVNYGIYVDNLVSMVEVSSNRILDVVSNPEEPGGTSGVYLDNVSEVSVFNNFIHTTGVQPVKGISLNDITTCEVHYNSINIATEDLQGRSYGIFVDASNGLFARNNIFYNHRQGIPVSIDNSTGIDFDYSDYYSSSQVIGSYEGTLYSDLEGWSNVTGFDQSSLSVHPFFTSASDLSMNQALLNNAGVPVNGISFDIDGTSRNAVSPDIGAKEYDPCNRDAGINDVVNPENPLSPGNQQVTLLLQNQGSSTLNSVKINWQVNDVVQAHYLWNGSLTQNENEEVTVGSFEFEAGEIYVIKAWTSNPNGTTDCNHINDTIYSRQLAAPLCGNYTIGGFNPDFEDFIEASTILNLAGITCPVVFNVRDGVYLDNFRLGMIDGASSNNTITFRSETADSTGAILEIIPESHKFDPIVYLDGSQYIHFDKIGFRTGADINNNTYGILMENCNEIEIESCYFEVRKSYDVGLIIRDGCEDLYLASCFIDCINKTASAIGVYGEQTKDVEITGNIISGTSEWGYKTIDIDRFASYILVEENTISNVNIAVYMNGVNNVAVRGNHINDANFGIFVDNSCTLIELSANRLSNVNGHEEAPGGTSGMLVRTSQLVDIFNNFIHTSGSDAVSGIALQGSSDMLVHFNSVNVSSNDPQSMSRGIFLSGNTNIIGRNNILNVNSAGTPVYIEGTSQQIDFDHNNYFSYNKIIGFYDGDFYSSTEDWSNATGFDQDAVSTNPFFTSPTNLSINQILLNNTAETVPGIPNDIDGTTRNPSTPDIGAKEYDPCGNDAGINALLSPVNPLSTGQQDIIVVLQNQGTVTLTGVDIQWSVNGVAQDAFNWTGNLASAANEEVNIGSYDFQPGLVYVIGVWTHSPNGATDCNHYNDTTYSQVLSSPLCGDYTIGGVNPDYETFTEASIVLNQAGISCPVRFFVRDGLFEEQFSIGSIPGSSETNTVMFVSESGDSTSAILSISDNATQNESILTLNECSNIIFSKLGFETGTASGNNNFAMKIENASNISLENCQVLPQRNSDVGIIIEESSQNITISECNMVCENPRSTAMIISGSGINNISLKDNIIKGAIIQNYTTVKVGPGVDQMEITGNLFRGCSHAISITDSRDILFKHNHIDDCDKGLYVDVGCERIEIIANRLTNMNNSQMQASGTIGIYVSGSANIDLINNYVQANGPGFMTGIRVNNSDTCRMLFNSVNMGTEDIEQKSKGLHLTGVRQFNGRNNIAHIKTNGLPIHLQTEFSGLNIDYNNYYSPAGIIGRIDNQDYTNLNQWGSTISGDANSLAVDAFFKVDTVPLPYQRALNGAGIPVPGVIDDINGITRNPQAPDMGCYEFLVDIGITELITPTNECFHPEQDSVTVYIKKFGDLPFEDIDIALQIDGGPVRIESIPGTIETDLVYTFDTLINISTYGEYFFKIWLIGTLDDNINNDTLAEWRASSPIPTAFIEWDNFCTGKTVNFFGTGTVPAPSYIDGYEWLFGDGDTATGQNTVHTYAEGGTYDVTLRVYTEAGCFNDTTISIFIDPNFEGLSMDLDVNPVHCHGASDGSITIRASGSYPPYNYYLNGSLLTDSIASGLGEGTYIVEVIDSENCTVTDTVTFAADVFMNPQIIASPLEGDAPLVVDFDFTADGAVSWTWYFSDEDTDTNKATSYTFVKFGSNLVTLEVNSGPPFFCVETTTIEIFVNVIVTIQPNNIFSPNNDGYNDYFDVYTLGITEITVNIFNQWGNKLYVIDSIGGRWDGITESGQEAPDGTYFFDLRVIDIYGLVHHREGTVMLVRHGTYANPNPTDGQVRIKTFNTLQGPVDVFVYSVFGQLVHAGKLNDPLNMVLDLSHLKQGVYMIKLTDGIDNNFVRIIKQ
jgi:gliding motility-associated-like protein